MKLSDVSDKITDLTLAELHSLVEDLRSLMRSKAPAIIDEYLAIAKGSFGSLPHNTRAQWLTRITPDGFTFTWDFLGETVFDISGGIPFERFSATCYGEPGGRSEFFDSFTDAIQSLKTRCRNAVGLYSRLNRVLGGKDYLFCSGVAIAAGGYAVLFENDDDPHSTEIKRSVEIAVGPINVYCNQGRHFVEKGKAHVLLSLYKPCEYEGCEREELVAPYEFESEAEAISWIEKHANDLCNPDEFDLAFLSKSSD